jgi:hypothetical protein
VVIEFGDSRNRQISFAPTAGVYRGTWSKGNLVPDEMTELIQKIPDFPGVRAAIDPARRSGMVFDPMALPENKELLGQVQRRIKEVFGADQGPERELVVSDLDDTDVKTWLYWMRRLADNKQARVVSGVLPTMEEIRRLPGKRRMEAFNTSSRACKFEEEYAGYCDALQSTGRRPGS